MSNLNTSRFSREPLLKGIKNRLLQLIALFAPGQATLRATLHRWRGVRMGKPVYIGTDVLIETAYPEWVQIGNNVVIGMRTTIGHVNEPFDRQRVVAASDFSWFIAGHT